MDLYIIVSKTKIKGSVTSSNISGFQLLHTHMYMHCILMPKYQHTKKSNALHTDSIEQVYQVKILQGVHVCKVKVR